MRSLKLMRWKIPLLLALLFASAQPVRAQSVSNAATGVSGGVPLDSSQAMVTLTRQVVPGVASTAEIAPTRVIAGSAGNVFTWDLLATVLPSDPSLDQVALTAPAGYANFAVLSVTVSGVALSARCPNPGSGQYCATVAGSTVTVRFGQPLADTTAHLQINVSASVPGIDGIADFSSSTVSIGGTRASTIGDADGDATDANSMTVRVYALPDTTQSTVTVNPPVVFSDGVAFSTITATVRDGTGIPLPGRGVVFTTDRGAADVLAQPVAFTDSAGRVTGTIRSNLAGISTISARDTSDALTVGMHPTVTFTQREVLLLQKLADRAEVVIGDVVNYTVVLRNTIAWPVSNVRVEDQPPADFKYLRGSASVDGVHAADPLGSGPLTFVLGTVPAFVDANANGQADPGEPGYVTLRYQLVVGSGATPGYYRNVAIARDVCDACLLSNAGEAGVRVRVDEMFGLGTIVGRVFDDHDRDGRQGRDEGGVARAKVALDDGTYALTDDHGLYHIAGIRPGDRVVKIDVASIPGVAHATTEQTRLVTVSPGLLAKANFGIEMVRDTLRSGRPAMPGLEIAGQATPEPAMLVGTVEGPKLLLNGDLLTLPDGDVRLSIAGLSESVQIKDRQLAGPLRFEISANDPKFIRSWTFTIMGAQGDIERTFEGEGPPPRAVTWDGVKNDGTRLSGGELHQYQLSLLYRDGIRASSPVRTFGVDRSTTIALTMTGKAFQSGNAVLSADARDALTKVADLIRRHPGETVFIEGYTDSVGPAELNLALSGARAKSAAAFLTDEQQIPKDRLVLRWYGEARPVATNATEAGREKNRRVEIHGKMVDRQEAQITDRQRRQPLVKINGDTLSIDAGGRFATQVPASVERIDILVRDAAGRVIHSAVPLPDVEILQPLGTQRVAFGANEGPYRVAPLAPGVTAGALRLSSGADEAGSEPVGTCQLVGRTAPGNLVQLDQREFFADTTGLFHATLDLQLGYNTYGVMVRNAAGATRLVNLLLTVANEDAGGKLLIAVDRQPDLTVALPPVDAPLMSDTYPISGVTNPGNHVRVNGQDVPVRVDGSFHYSAPLPRGSSHMLIQAIDQAGQVSTLERDVVRVPQKLFFLGLADGTLGQLRGKGFVDGAGRLANTGLYADGRLAYYLKGYVAGKYLVTSAFDTRTSGFEKILVDVDDNTNDRLLTNLDPDRLYPVYGDSSSVVYDAQAQGRFFLAVESDEFQALVGNYAMSLNDTELSGFQRTLYGARVQYHSVSRTRYGQPRTTIALLGAEASQVHVRDELRGTGGSVYYLSHPDLIEGSEQVSLAVRDATTGLVIARMPQRRNMDYTVKYREGRILFSRPVASVLDDGSLVSTTVLPGSPVTIEIDYETSVQGLDRSATGGHVQQHLGDHMALGGTYLKDDVGVGGYELHGADAELRAGRNSRISGELASSNGASSRVYSSLDGGVSFQEQTPNGLKEGKAWKAAADLDVGEWFGAPDRAMLKAYVKRVEHDFFSNGSTQDRGTQKAGVSANVGLTKHDKLGAHFDRDEQFRSPADTVANGRVSNLAALSFAHDAGRWGFGTEFQARSFEDAVRRMTDRSSYGTGSVWFKPSARLSARLEQQSTFGGPRNDQGRASLQYQLTQHLALDARGVTGSLGNSLQGGATFATGGGRSVYVNQRLTDDTHAHTAATVLGAQTPFGRGSRAYSEYQWEQAAAGSRRISLLGLQQQWQRGAGTTLFASGEYGQTQATQGATRRSALAGGFAWSPKEALHVSSRAEWRRDRGAIERRQVLWTDHAESRLTDNLVVLGDFRYSRTRDLVAGRDEARFQEHALGLAYRPLTNDRINGVARYTRLDEMGPSVGADSSHAGTLMDVFAAEATVDLNAMVQWSGKGALRAMRERSQGSPEARTRTSLMLSRVSTAVRGPLRFGVEYRVLGQREAHDRRQGWLNELTYDLTRNMRVGGGYNYTDFSDSEFSKNDYSVRGWFVRAQGRY